VGDNGLRSAVRRPALGLVLIAIAGLLLAGCASKHPSAAPSQRLAAATPHGTVTKSFQAYTAAGQLAGQVGDVATGNCWTTSVAAPVAGAYRCFAGNKILDPCFAAPGKANDRQVACFASPWADAIVLTLTSDLPAPGSGPGATRPWAFQLGNGARCVASTGTVPAVLGVNLEYHCTNGADAATPDTSATTATAEYGSVAAGRVQSVTVTTIWRG
jgi:hypothetical protein